MFKILNESLIFIQTEHLVIRLSRKLLYASVHTVVWPGPMGFTEFHTLAPAGAPLQIVAVGVCTSMKRIANEYVAIQIR